tara:strand:- start:153 stop:491 length:339 start_codon:yes stop_codon:yes gene_type:complete
MAYSGSATKRLTAQLRLAGGFESKTLAANLTLDSTSANYLRIDPDGSARDVNLPAEETSDGLFFQFFNAGSGSENLVVKNDNGDTIETVAPGEMCLLGCDGTSWIIIMPGHT